jgi:hypothetical protein
MRIAWIAVAVVTLIALPASAGPPEVQLLENGDFERGLAGWRALDMSGQCKFEADTKTRQSGKQSMRVEKSGPGRPDFLKQSAELPAGAKEVHATCWFKVDKGARAEVTVYFFDAAGATIGKGDLALVAAGPNKKFEKAEERYEVPKGASGVGVNVMAKGAGVFWIDGLEIACAGVAATAGPPAVVNGGFESGLDGWKPLAFGSDSAEAKEDAAVHGEGKASARIARTSARLLPEDGLSTEVIAGADLGKVRLQCQARTQGDARAAIALQAFDEKGVCVATARAPITPPEDQFAAGEIALATPAGARKLVVSLIVVGAGTAWFDDVALEQVK